MNKEEIHEKISMLKFSISRPGRSYSKSERDAMREEIEVLSQSLDLITEKENFEFVEKTLKIEPLFWINDIKKTGDKISKLDKKILDINLRLLIEERLKQAKSQNDQCLSSQKSAIELSEFITLLKNGNPIPFPNKHSFITLNKAINLLASEIMRIETLIGITNITLNEIDKIIQFHSSNKIYEGFIYLTKAIFIEGSNFEAGYATIRKNNTKHYLTADCELLNIDSDENTIPKIHKERANPELTPFIDTANKLKLMGYKNDKGETIVTPQYRYAENFFNGYAKVCKIKYDIRLYGLIDKNGKEVLPCMFTNLDNVYNDIIKFTKYIGEQSYERVSSFSFDVKTVFKSRGPYTGYLIFGNLKSKIFKCIEEIKSLKEEFKKTNNDNEQESISNKLRSKEYEIKMYLECVINLS